MTTQTINTNSTKSKTNHDWAITVTEEQAFSCFYSTHYSITKLMKQGYKEQSIQALNDYEALAKAYHSHLSDNKAFYHGNKEATDYLTNVQRRLVKLVHLTNTILQDTYDQLYK